MTKRRGGAGYDPDWYIYLIFWARYGSLGAWVYHDDCTGRSAYILTGKSLTPVLIPFCNSVLISLKPAAVKQRRKVSSCL